MIYVHFRDGSVTRNEKFLIPKNKLMLEVNIKSKVNGITEEIGDCGILKLPLLKRL